MLRIIASQGRVGTQPNNVGGASGTPIKQVHLGVSFFGQLQLPAAFSLRHASERMTLPHARGSHLMQHIHIFTLLRFWNKNQIF